MMLVWALLLAGLALPRLPLPDGQHLEFDLLAMIQAYFDFVTSGGGGILTVALSVVVCSCLMFWGWRTRRPDVRAVLITALVLTLLLVLIFVEGTRIGWWRGTFVHYLPLGIQVAILFPVVLLGLFVWMGGYCWIATRFRYPQLIYLAIGILIIVAAAAADRAELSQGLIDVGDGNVWFNALIFVAIIFGPLVLYDVVRRALMRELLP